MGPTAQRGPSIIYSSKEDSPPTKPIDSPKGLGHMVHHMAKPGPTGSKPWKASKRPRSRDIRNVSHRRSSPRSGHICPETWVSTIWMQEDTWAWHAETHVPEDTKAHILEVETHDQRAGSLYFWGKPTPSFSINTNLPSGIPLAEIIVIKAYTYIF
jgi:hypothetical protein